MLIVLDCKDYARPVDVRGVEEFQGLLMDVGAHKGALVCPMGFTEAAKSRAVGLQVDLYSPVDTDPHKWQAKVTVPAVCDFRSAAISFGVSCSVPMPLKLPNGFFSEVVAEDEGGVKLGTTLDMAMKRWNEGKFPIEPGEHRRLAIFEKPEVRIDNGYGSLIPVTLTASLSVRQQLYFGEMSVARISGFRNELSGSVITNAFTLGIFDPNEIMHS